MSHLPSSSALAFEALLSAEDRYTLRRIEASYGIGLGMWVAVAGIRQQWEHMAIENGRAMLRAEGLTDERALLTVCEQCGVEPKTHESRRYRAQCVLVPRLQQLNQRSA